MSNSLNLIDIYKINVFPSFSDDDYNIQLNEKKLNLENEKFDVFSNENFQFLPKEKFVLQKKEINFQIINKTKEQNKNINNNNNNNKIFSLFIETPTLFDINRSYSKINQIKINNSNNKKNFFSSSLIKPINLKPFSINATKKTNNNNNFNNNNNNFNNNFNTNINNNINNNNNRNEINNLSNIEIKNKLLNSYNSNLSNIKNTNNEEYFNTEPSLNNFITKENNNNLIISNNNNINYNKKHKNKLFQYLPKLRSKSQNKIDNNNNNNYNKKIDIRSELLDLDNQYESVKKDLIEINP